jgi:ABC-type transport system involved in cytochrome c biogenesis permease subunit
MQAKVARILFWCTLAAATLGLIGGWWVASKDPTAGPYDLDGFAKLPVTHKGRVKPIDSVARDALDRFRGRQTAKTETGTKPAVRWYLDVIAPAQNANHDKIFRVDHPGLKDALELTEEDGKYVSLSQIRPHWRTLTRQARQASQLDRSKRSLYQKQVLDLANHVTRFAELKNMKAPYIIPPQNPGGQWQHFREAGSQTAQNLQAGNLEAASASISEPLRYWGTMIDAYSNQNPKQFNQAVQQYTNYLDSLIPGSMTRARLEVLTLNRFGPFYVSSILAIGLFLLGCLSWLVWMKPLRSIALALAIVILALVTFGIIARIYIQVRPPVTNLYSSMIFVAWGLLLLGLILDTIFRNSIGLVIGAVGSFVCLVMAQNWASGDTMEMQQAVLDTNFWLATHVTTVTMGYVATFAAGLLGIIFIGLGVTATLMNPEARQSLAGTGRTLTRMLYGVICFALLLSFVGTVLGGLWADYSWGRFWGWDPKENGAAIIVLMNALIIHARWGGIVKERGMAVLAVCGNIVTAWSWFGVNLLGVGLHSYGFMDNGWLWMGLFVLSQLAIIAIGLMPLEIWHGSVLMKSPKRVQMERAKQQRQAGGGGAAPGAPSPPTDLPPGTPKPAGGS